MLKAVALLVACNLLAPAETRVVTLGSGKPQPNPDRSGPTLAVVHNGRAHLFVSGPDIRRRAAAAAARLKTPALQVPRLSLVFLTHLDGHHTIAPKATRATTEPLIQPWKHDIQEIEPGVAFSESHIERTAFPVRHRRVASYKQLFHNSSKEMAAVASRPKTLTLCHLVAAGTTGDGFISEVQSENQGRRSLPGDLGKSMNEWH
jgi:hypothetical protein